MGGPWAVSSGGCRPPTSASRVPISFQGPERLHEPEASAEGITSASADASERAPSRKKPKQAKEAARLLGPRECSQLLLPYLKLAAADERLRRAERGGRRHAELRCLEARILGQPDHRSDCAGELDMLATPKSRRWQEHWRPGTFTRRCKDRQALRAGQQAWHA